MLWVRVFLTALLPNTQAQVFDKRHKTSLTSEQC